MLREPQKSISDCSRKLLTRYLSDKLDIDEKLDFFSHLEECPECWDEVYNAVRAQHPHYYKTKSQLKVSEKEIKEFESKDKAIFEVA